jgi:uncharacterized protein YbjT (DUF2867 family)
MSLSGGGPASPAGRTTRPPGISRPPRLASRMLVLGGGLGTLPAMEVLVIGGHGQIGLRLLRLVARDGHRGRGVIRKAEQASDLEAAGADAVLCDLERGDDLRSHVGAADAIVFAAGAGPGSGPERKRTVDYGAAVTSMEAAGELGVTRFVIVSSIGTHDVAGAAAAMRPYLQVKRDADDALKQSLDWTILTSSPPYRTGIPAVPLMRHLGGFLLRCRLPPLLAV